MCPMCISNAVLMAGGVTSTGGLAALALKKLGVSVKSAVDDNSKQRRDHDADEHGGKPEDSVAR
jgi:hypothetical protein